MPVNRPFVIESLEPRTMLAGHPALMATYYSASEVLTVDGYASRPNNIVVNVQQGMPNQFVVFINGNPTEIVKDPPSSGKGTIIFGVPIAMVRLIVVRGGSRSDDIQVDDANAAESVPAYIAGYGGNDTLSGGSGDDTIL